MLVRPDSAVLSRLGLGPSDASLAELGRLGAAGWLEQQLHPDDGADGDCLARLGRTRARIKYPEGKDWPAMDEVRPLGWLDASMAQLWALNERNRSLAGAERVRPRVEVCLATLTRAVYSRWQLREVLCDFWHNHFSVNAWDHQIGVALPVYDREVIRRHCLGNFREMLEAVAKSAAMLCYLNNRSSRAGAPNENYARELFELHTLGRDAYLNGLYNRWRDVPGAASGRPAGYIDQDVYEAARAFTGWGLEDGSGTGAGANLPQTGAFAYVESWHDNYQKRVLASEFDPYQPAQADGRKVLDLAAFHPACARHVVGKLIRRLVSDQVPESLLAGAVRVWSDHRDKPDQIARVVRFIAQSPEAARVKEPKVRRPLELAVAFVRATALDFSASEGLVGELDAAGQRLFGWPTPTGHPDQADYWLGPNTMRRRWTLVAGLAENWWGCGNFDALASFGKEAEAGAFLDYWSRRLYREPAPALIPAVLNAAGLAPGKLINNPGQARRLVAWCAMAPEFQLR